MEGQGSTCASSSPSPALRAGRPQEHHQFLPFAPSIKALYPTGAEQLVLEGLGASTSDCDPLQPLHRASMENKSGTVADHGISPEKGAYSASALFVLSCLTSQAGVTCE